MNGFSVKLSWPAWYWLTALCFLAFVLVTRQMLAAGPQSFDMTCAEYFQGHAHSHLWLRDFFWGVTQLGSSLVLGVLAGIVVSALVLFKKRFFAVVWLFAVVGGALLNYGIKGHFERVRPPPSLRDPAVAHLSSLSYPSGHAMGSTIGLGLCVYLVFRRIHRRPFKVLAAAGLILLIGLIGLSRIYLRAHWCSDVIGGIAVGATWVTFCLGIYEWRRRTVPVPLPEEEEAEEEENV